MPLRLPFRPVADQIQRGHDEPRPHPRPHVGAGGDRDDDLHGAVPRAPRLGMALPAPRVDDCDARRTSVAEPEGRSVILAFLPLAFAHPMGTGSTNRSALLVVSERGTRLRYLVDFAEDPSVAELARIDAADKAAWAAARIAELVRGIALTVDGAGVALTVNKCLPSVGQGEGARPVVLLVCDLVGPTLRAGRIRLEDHNFDGLPGWREMFVTGDG